MSDSITLGNGEPGCAHCDLANLIGDYAEKCKASGNTLSIEALQSALLRLAAEVVMQIPEEVREEYLHRCIRYLVLHCGYRVADTIGPTVGRA